MKLMLGCKEATLLLVMSEERSLSNSERLKLSLHLKMCKFCRFFEKQNKFISINATNISSSKNFTRAEKDNLISFLNSIKIEKAK